jgi:hypothetical protein
MGQDVCMLCGEPLPPEPWWKRFFMSGPPTHKPKGAEGDACWKKFNDRMGVKNPGPRPT